MQSSEVRGAEASPANEQKKLASLMDFFQMSFGSSEGARLFSAPGRIEIGGNHTDHQQGRVLAAAVSLEALAAAAPNENNTINILSNENPPVVVQLDDLSPRASERGQSPALVRGIAEYFFNMGWKTGGFNAVTKNEVPGGSGLSSSAAFEVLIGTVFNGLFNCGGISPVDLAKAGQYAENVHFGKPCGLMDQMASALGGIAEIDFINPAEPRVERLSVDFSAFGHAVCIIDTGSYHADLNDEYASIPAEMTHIAGFFGKSRLREVDPSEFYASVPMLRGKASDRAILRAMHFFSDNERAHLEAEALKHGDFSEFLSLIRESGKSSWMLLQNIYPSGASAEQPAALALSYCERLLAGDGACRIHGGGFAGTMQAFVPLARLEEFRAGIESLTGSGSCRVLSIRPQGGIELI